MIKIVIHNGRNGCDLIQFYRIKITSPMGKVNLPQENTKEKRFDRKSNSQTKIKNFVVLWEVVLSFLFCLMFQGYEGIYFRRFFLFKIWFSVCFFYADEIKCY